MRLRSVLLLSIMLFVARPSGALNPVVTWLFNWAGGEVLSWGVREFANWLFEQPPSRVEQSVSAISYELHEQRRMTDANLSKLRGELSSTRQEIRRVQSDTNIALAQEIKRLAIYTEALEQLEGSSQFLEDYLQFLGEVENLGGVAARRDPAAAAYFYQRARKFSRFEPERYFNLAVVRNLQAQKSRIMAVEGRLTAAERAIAERELENIRQWKELVEQGERLDLTEGKLASLERELQEHSDDLRSHDSRIAENTETLASLMAWVRSSCCSESRSSLARSLVLNANDMGKYYPYLGRHLQGLLAGRAARKGLQLIGFPKGNPENVVLFLDYWVICRALGGLRQHRCVAELVLRSNQQNSELARCEMEGFGRTDDEAYNDLEAEMNRRSHEIGDILDEMDCGGG